MMASPSYHGYDVTDYRAINPDYGTMADFEEMLAGMHERGIKFGHLVHPIRAALTGTTRGPGLFDCMFLLGKERCLARLRR